MALFPSTPPNSSYQSPHRPHIAPELANDVLHQRNAKELLALMCLAPGVAIDSAEAGLSHHPSARRAGYFLSRAHRQRSTRHVASSGHQRTHSAEVETRADRIFYRADESDYHACIHDPGKHADRPGRRKELVIRLAVGASRSRLVRQMMSEGILLSLLGGVAGVALAYGLGLLNPRVTSPVTIPQESNLS